MGMHSEILRYMGHKGEADTRLQTLISSCMEKLAAVCVPRHVVKQLPCTVASDYVTIDTLEIKSTSLAIHLGNCAQVYIFAATLGADVDRLILQRTKIDSTEALCIQACSAAHIENYCSSIEHELAGTNKSKGLYLRPRFSPGYGDFDIACQTNLLYALQAQKHIGLSETKNHMLTPLKSITAVIGICLENSARAEGDVLPADKCINCSNTDCPYRR